MYTADQVIEGLMAYIRREVIPVMPAGAKLAAGAVLIHNAGRANELLKAGGTLRTIGLIDAEGCVDVDRWAQDLRSSMEEYCSGRAEIKLPILQPIIINTGDIDTLKRYLKGELR